MNRFEQEHSLRNDVKTLRDISKTMESHGYYKSIPMVLNNIADDIEEYLKSGAIEVVLDSPSMTMSDEFFRDILAKTEKIGTKRTVGM